MHPQSLARLRQIRVLYVDDTGATEESKVKEYVKRNEENFWSEATHLCPNHIGLPTVRCVNCIFTLEFFPHFPPALYALLEGRKYDVYLVDIHADQSASLNRWDDPLYEAQARQFEERLRQLFPELRGKTVINGERHIIPLIAKQQHALRPFVVWMSIKHEPQRALDSGGNFSMIARKGKDLLGILATAIKWLELQILEKFSVPLPIKALSLPVNNEYLVPEPIFLDFKQRKLLIATGVEITSVDNTPIVTPGLPLELGTPLVIELAGGATRTLPLRYLIRGGKLSKQTSERLRAAPSRSIEASGSESEKRKRQLRKYPDLAKVLKDFSRKVTSRGQFTIWNKDLGLKIGSSVELAWRYLYHAVVQLYVHSISAGEDLSEFEETMLARDAKRFDKLGALAIAEQFSHEALNLGSDDFGRDSGDLELLWIPQVLSLTIELEKDPDLSFAQSLKELRLRPLQILNEMFNETNQTVRLMRLTLFCDWLRSGSLYDLTRTLYEIDQGSKPVTEMKREVFRIYRDGESIHERF